MGRTAPICDPRNLCASSVCLICFFQILGCIDVELRRHGEEPLTEEDKLPFRRFAESKRIEAVDTPSGVISEASAFSLTSISQALPPLGMSRR